MEQIIYDMTIDTEAATRFLNDCYHDINLLPNVPDTLTKQMAAAVLGVSLPTIDRMVQAQQILLTKDSLMQYILEHMLYTRPILDKDTEKREDNQKSFPDAEENISACTRLPPIENGLFSDADLQQE